jgi:hypothetical protein
MRILSRVLLALGVPLFLMGWCAATFIKWYGGLYADPGMAGQVARIGLLLCCVGIAPIVATMGGRQATFLGGAMLSVLGGGGLLLAGRSGLDTFVPLLLVGLIALGSNAIAAGREMRWSGGTIAVLGLALTLLSLISEDGWRWMTWGDGYSPNSLGTVAMLSGLAIVACGIVLCALSFLAGSPLTSPWKWRPWGPVAGRRPVTDHLDKVARGHIAELERVRKRNSDSS